MIRLFNLIICLQFFAKNINTIKQKSSLSAERSSVTLKSCSPLTKQNYNMQFKKSDSGNYLSASTGTFMAV